MRGFTLAARLALAATLAGASAWAFAQSGPESLLPGDYDRPAPRASRPAVPRPSAAPARAPAATPARPAAGPTPAPSSSPRITAAPVVPGFSTAGPSPTPSAAPAAISGHALSAELAALFPNGIRSMADIERLPPDKLDELLGLKPRYDIPPGARRALLRVGVIGSGEGGLPPFALAHQDADLVRATLAGNSGQLVSRWGHILLRRALASRLDAPEAMDPADFAALRAALLLRMGEGDAARTLVQDVDPEAYSPALVDAALDTYVATADFTGMCPVQAQWPALRKDGEWQVLKAVCATFSGNGAAGFAQLDHLTYRGAMPRIDMLLAQKYAGAAGKARRAVTIEWKGVDDLTPWRYALTIGTGLTPPGDLLQQTGGRFDAVSALAPMLPLGVRADASDRAGGIGVLSAAAMVDLYSQVYADEAVSGDAAARADLLRDCYVAETPQARLAAMRKLWDGAGTPMARWSRVVLTAYAAARMPVGSVSGDDAADLIAAMLSAGLDANALRWRNAVDAGSRGWALLALAQANGAAENGPLSSFHDSDKSEKQRKTAFLLAGLAGLGRVTPAARSDLAEKLGISLEGQTRWTRAIDGAAAVHNPALVALLAGLGMQGSGWDRMTPRHLYHIVAALNRVGLGAEARMIAAEAVARG